MLKTVTRLSPTAIFPLIGRRNEHDYDAIKNPIETPKTGIDRVKRMYSRNDYGEVSVELHTVAQSSLSGAFFGACFGGFLKSRDAYLYFIENNQASIFKSTGEAKKKLQDYVTVAFAKGAYTWGWRLGIFTGIFSLLATTISVYRNDTTLVEYVVAGAITGGLFKANLGLAATFVGAGLGAVLSALGGALIVGILYITGVSMADIRKAMYNIKLAREDQYKQALEKASTIKNDNLTRHHDLILEEKGVKKIEEIS